MLASDLARRRSAERYGAGSRRERDGMLAGNSIALATQQVVAPIQGMHRAISERWFAAAGTPARPFRMMHLAVSDVVYGSIRAGGTIAGWAFDTRLSDTSPISESLQSVVNGLWGDTLDPDAGHLEIAMGVRDQSGSRVSIPTGLDRAFPGTTGNLVVLVHGLFETERCWKGTEEGPGLVEALEDQPQLTPVLIRYNAGLRISENGVHLADLLDELRTAWPVPVESVSLVGHSMGGLVIRSACGVAEEAGQRWIRDVDDVVTLGTPHQGAPLEKAVNVAAWALARVPDTRPLAEFLNVRSGGIKDLRFGSVTEDDWHDADPDLLLQDTVGRHPLPSGIRHHFVAGVATADPAHPLGRAIGDLVVRANSATGGRDLDPTSEVVLGGVRHLDLPRKPVVVERVMAWLAGADS